MTKPIVSWAWNQSLPPSQKVVLLAIAEFCEQDGQSQDRPRISQLTGLGKSAVLTAVESLMAKGLLSRRGNRLYIACPWLEARP